MECFISGSTKGIGKQLGIDLVNQKHFVYFNGSTEESCVNLGIQLRNYENFNVLRADLSNINEVTWIAEQIDSLDVLILNAGITDRTQFGEIKLEEWNKVLNVNLTNQFFLVQKLKDKINNNGRIIFISSILSKIPQGVSISYSVSKAGINILVPRLAKEFADKGITVNAICPGFIESENWHKNKTKEQLDNICNQNLLKRFGTQKEISSLVQEIINNQYINGTTIDITGGYNL